MNRLTPTMGDYVRAIGPSAPRTVVSERDFQSILEIADFLPPCTVGGFEVALGRGETHADFQVQLPPHPLRAPEAPLNGRTWQWLQAYCEEWLDEASAVNDIVTGVGLEFDVTSGQNLDPAVFIALTRAAAADRRLPVAAVERLMAGWASPRTISAVRAFVEALPPEAGVGFIGAMVSRAPDWVRVNISGLAPDHQSRFFERLSWPDSMKPAVPLLSGLAALVDDVALCFDFATGLNPVLGIECILRTQPTGEPRWRLLLDHLADLGLCDPARQQALFLWPGDTTAAAARERWPDNLSLGDRLLFGRAISTFYRYVSHLKVTYQPDRPPKAKAYLGFCHQWVPAPAGAGVGSGGAYAD